MKTEQYDMFMVIIARIGFILAAAGIAAIQFSQFAKSL